MELDVRTWLEQNGFGQYADAFEAQQIDAEALPGVTDEHLKELGIPLGPRIKLLAAIEKLSNRPTGLSAPERRQLTVMFVDLVGSTALAARLDPEELREVMRQYLDAVALEVARYEGYIARYQGDGVMVYFGYPKAHEDDAERAVHAALAIVRAVASLRAQGGAALSSRVGIATGLVIVGDLLGEGAAREYAVVGETPNLAARLESLAGIGEVLISERTRALVGDLFHVRQLPPREVKGLASPVTAYAVVDERPVESRFEARRASRIAAMVGRDGELALLRDRWRSACIGEGQVVVISGEAGIGKSRILRALEDSLAGQKHVRIHNQCSPYHAESALFPAIQQLSRAAGFAAGDNRAVRVEKIRGLLSGAPSSEVLLIEELLGLQAPAAEGADKTPQQRRLQTFEALLGQVARLAEEQPVLWVLEDAHWIDPTTLELLELSVDRMAEMRLLAVVTGRPEFQHEFGRRRHVTRISLNRLGRAQIGALMSDLTGGKAFPDELVDLVAAKTDGVPLFVEELTRTMLESGRVHETATGFVLDGRPQDIVLPSSLHDSLMARLDRLKSLKEVAQAAACIGREFELPLLAHICGGSEAALRSGVERLQDAGIVYRRGGIEEGRYVFKHALVRDAAYESLLKARRQEIHGRLVLALETAPDTAPELMAYHATQAGLAEKAIEYWQRAGTQAVRRPAYKEAISHFSEAMRLSERMGEERAWQERRLMLLMALGQASIPLRGYSHPHTAAVFTRAQQLAGCIKDAPHRVSIAYAVWVSHYVAGAQDKALETARAMLQLARQEGHDGRVLTALRALGISQMITGAPSLARATFEEAGAVARALRGRSPEQRMEVAYRFAADPEIATEFHVALTLWSLGEVEKARRVAERAVEAAREMAHPHTLGHALAHGAIFAVVSRNAAAALELGTETMDFADRHDMELWKAYGAILRAYALALQEEYAASAPLMERGLAAMTKTHTGAMIPLHRAVQAVTLARLGRMDEAATQAQRVAEELRNGSERFFWPECHRLLGDYAGLCASAPSDEAELAYGRALEVAREHGANSWELYAATSLARLWNERGERRRSAELLKPVLARYAGVSTWAPLEEAKRISA
jgi:class 3 adenylate cyclase/tetratricopeptide (TPR) repeat protein